MNRTIIIGIVGVVVVLAALGLNYWLSTEDSSQSVVITPGPERTPEPLPIPGQPETAERTKPAPVPTETAEAPEPAPENPPQAQQEPPQGEQAAPAQPETQTAVAEPGQPAPAPQAATIVLPEFDVVRVTPTGDIVVAGRAASGSVVTVYDGGRPIGNIKADSRGEWVMLPDEPLPPGSRELSLSSRLGDAEPVWSERVVVVVVPEAGLDVAGKPSKESSGALVVEVPRSGFGTTDVLQQPPAENGEPLPAGTAMALSVDVLDYDEQGNLGLSGHAGAGSNVLVYLDNGLLAATPVAPDGTWRIIVERPVAPGLYTLRVDEMAGEKVVARLEFPFQRVDPQEIDTGTLLVVVQPGNSLWRLARRTLGEGMRYTVIYQANKDRIRDPDLIYPGQVFVVPRTN